MARDLLSFFLPFPLWLIACKFGLPCRRILLFFLNVSLCVYRCEKQQRRRKAAYTFLNAHEEHATMWLLSSIQCSKTKFFLGVSFLISDPDLMSIKQLSLKNLFEFFKSTLFNTASSHHLPPLRFHCVVGCWDWTQDLASFQWAITRLDLLHNEDEI